MNAELTAAIIRGHAEIAERKRLDEEAAAERQREEDERLRGYLKILPEWMREYARVDDEDDTDIAITVTLPGCSPFTVEKTRAGISSVAWVHDPLGIAYNPKHGEWFVDCQMEQKYNLGLDALTAFAADCGESYWAMRREAEQRNMAGITPHKDAPAMPAPAPVVDAQPDPLERIADALERIAERLDGFSDNGEANDALRVNVLR